MEADSDYTKTVLTALIGIAFLFLSILLIHLVVAQDSSLASDQKMSTLTDVKSMKVDSGMVKEETDKDVKQESEDVNDDFKKLKESFEKEFEESKEHTEIEKCIESLKQEFEERDIKVDMQTLKKKCVEEKMDMTDERFKKENKLDECIKKLKEKLVEQNIENVTLEGLKNKCLVELSSEHQLDSLEVKIEKCVKELQSSLDEPIEVLKKKCIEKIKRTVFGHEDKLTKCEEVDSRLKEINKLILQHQAEKDELRKKQIQEKIRALKNAIEVIEDKCERLNGEAFKEHLRSEGGCEKVKKKLKLKLEKVYSKLEEAEKQHNEELIQKAKQELTFLEEKFSKFSCNDSSWIDDLTDENDVVTFYKGEMQRILREKKSIEEQIQELKELRNKIDNIIEELIKKKESLELDDIKDLVDKVEINADGIVAGNVKASLEGKTLKKRLQNKEVLIKKEGGFLVLIDGDLKVKLKNLEMEGNKIMSEGKELKLLPEEIKSKLSENIDEMELTKLKETLTYKIKAREKRKLLGFINVEAKKELYINAESGESELLKEKKPWWTFLSTKGE